MNAKHTDSADRVIIIIITSVMDRAKNSICTRVAQKSGRGRAAIMPNLWYKEKVKRTGKKKSGKNYGEKESFGCRRFTDRFARQLC